MKKYNNIKINDATVEYSIKTKKHNDINNIQITSSNICFNYIKSLYDDNINIYESCYIILLNQQKKTKGWVKISQGGITGTVVDVRLVAYFAVQSLSVGVILVHNHPSGNLTFSEQDINFCKRLKEGLGILDICLVDSIVLTDSGYISAADQGIV